MTGPLAALAGIEAFDGAVFDADLVDRLWRTGRDYADIPLNAAAPSFRSYESDELPPCGGGAFPAISLTGAACALDCAHCRAKILAPMTAATDPVALDRLVRKLAAQGPLRGFLLSGGSNRRNEVPFDRFLPVVARLKADFPALRIAAHTGLVDAGRAARLADAGVDVAMMDVIGAPETISEIYHLARPVADFEASLAALAATRMAVVPHIVVGLHFGRILGEYAALDIVARHEVTALVIVVVMPHYAEPGLFAPPAAATIGAFLGAARQRLQACDVLLGCARPPGRHRQIVDAYAVLAGLDGIAYPAPGAVTLARALGRKVTVDGACCAAACRHRAAA